MSRIVTSKELDAIVCDECQDAELLSDAYLGEWHALNDGRDLCQNCNQKAQK